MPPAKKAVAKKTGARAPARSTAANGSGTKKAPAKSPAAKKAAAPAKKAAAPKAAAKKAPVAKKAAAPAKKATTKTAASPNQKAAVPKNSTPPKTTFDKKFLDAQRELLLEERATYTRQAESLQAEADSLAELREPGDVQFDEESGEGDTLQVERERDLALSARARQEIDEIDRALAKIDEGTYGICEVSGQPIPKARLQAIPQARERVEYKVGGFGRR
jgi:RNA polymerase-binding transcription factor DksA